MLLDGYYQSSLSPSYIVIIEGNIARYENVSNVGIKQSDVYVGPCNYGKFGETAPKIKEKTGKDFYDVEFLMMDGTMKMYSVFHEDMKSFTNMGFYKEVETYHWISDEDLKASIDSCDPVDAPSTFYKIQPENQGKHVWVTGTPGAGKTTSAFILAKKHGFVYFEADCYFAHTNPYVPLDVESPAGAFFKQPPLKGVDRKRIEAGIKAEKFFEAMLSGITEEVHALGLEFYKEMAQYVKNERNRIGGDWAVAQAVPTRALRDEIKKILPDVTFVTLTIKEDALQKRIENRHGKEQSDINDWMMSIHKYYEPAEEDEPSAFNIDLETSMTPEDVVEIICNKLL